ncbi:MAG: MSCRAMM family adhesin SdrC [Lachnospiraceae bacterium]|nr:MSCRAMM family adhesin SdrC [Lachnospiraceae bacterium]
MEKKSKTIGNQVETIIIDFPDIDNLEEDSSSPLEQYYEEAELEKKPNPSENLKQEENPDSSEDSDQDSKSDSSEESNQDKIPNSGEEFLQDIQTEISDESEKDIQSDSSDESKRDTQSEPNEESQEKDIPIKEEKELLLKVHADMFTIYLIQGFLIFTALASIFAFIETRVHHLTMGATIGVMIICLFVLAVEGFFLFLEANTIITFDGTVYEYSGAFNKYKAFEANDIAVIKARPILDNQVLDKDGKKLFTYQGNAMEGAEFEMSLLKENPHILSVIYNNSKAKCLAECLQDGETFQMESLQELNELIEKQFTGIVYECEEDREKIG